MDEHRAREKAPDTMRQLEEPVRRFLYALDEKDIGKLEWLLSFDDKKMARYEYIDDLATTWQGAKRFGKSGAIVILTLLGISVTIRAGIEGWSWLLRLMRGAP